MKTENNSNGKMLENAILLATAAHKDQLDKAGAPYILHPLRCMMEILTKTGDYELASAMVMHDVVEDTDVTIDSMIKSEMFTVRVIRLVDALSRKNGESYDEFIIRCSMDVDSARLKLADLNDNMNLDRLPEVTDKDLARYEKYTIASLKLDKVVRAHELSHSQGDKKETPLKIEDIKFPITFKTGVTNITFINQKDGFWHIGGGKVPNYKDKTELTLAGFLGYPVLPSYTLEGEK